MNVEKPDSNQLRKEHPYMGHLLMGKFEEMPDFETNLEKTIASFALEQGLDKNPNYGEMPHGFYKFKPRKDYDIEFTVLFGEMRAIIGSHSLKAKKYERITVSDRTAEIIIDNSFTNFFRRYKPNIIDKIEDYNVYQVCDSVMVFEEDFAKEYLKVNGKRYDDTNISERAVPLMTRKGNYKIKDLPHDINGLSAIKLFLELSFMPREIGDTVKPYVTVSKFLNYMGEKFKND